MRLVRLASLAVLTLLVAVATGHAEKRVALVIGNSAYKSVPRLTNPVNDAGLVGGMFKKAGFDAVDVKQDLSAAEMRKALMTVVAAMPDIRRRITIDVDPLSVL